jgi:ABC-2 type transport system permease protein
MTGAPGQAEYLLVGNAAVAGVGTFAIASAAWDRWEGTYPLLIAAPGSMAPALMGRMAIWIGHWIASSFAAFAVLALVFGWRPPWTALLPVPAGVVLLSVSTYGLSLFLGALVGLVPALRNILINILTTVIVAFCGVSTPVSFWPRWLQIVAQALPTTHGVSAIRLMLGGGAAGDIVVQLGLEGAVALAWLAAALAAIDRVAEAGRANGSIEFS